jgi:ammonia channel protein AmtB
MEALKQGADALFILLGGIMVLAMHAGFAFLELGTVRRKNQVNAWSRFWWISPFRPWCISWSATAWPMAPTFLWVPSSWLPKMAMTWSSFSFC